MVPSEIVCCGALGRSVSSLLLPCISWPHVLKPFDLDQSARGRSVRSLVGSKRRSMTRLEETQRLTAEWVRRNSARARLEPIRSYDFRLCATGMNPERARQEANAAAAMARQFLLSQFTA